MIAKITDRRKDFPFLQETKTIYLDNAASTQKPQPVLDAVGKFYQSSYANVHRGIYTLSEKSTLAYASARKTVAEFIAAKSEEIIFTSGTTASINMLAYMLERKIDEGDEILLTEMEHHSNIVPWQQLAKRAGAVIKYIPLAEDFRLDLEKAKELLTERTKILAITQMSNVLGTINPIKEITALAHQHDTLVVVDAAQSVPHMPVDVKDLDCDFLAFSGHKMLAPTGIGVLYGKKEHLLALQPSFFGGGMIEEVTKEKSTWAELPEKFEAGTPNIAGAIGLQAAIIYLKAIGMNAIQQHEKEITAYALQKLSELPHVTLIGPSTKDRGAVISFKIEGMHPHDVSEILNHSNIAVRAGTHCSMLLLQKLNLAGTTRASFYVYNTTEDVDKLIAAIQKAQEVFHATN